VLSLSSSLSVAIAGGASDHAAYGTLNAVCHALPEILHLALCLLRLTLSILLLAFPLETLSTNEVAYGLLPGANGLVPV